MEPTQIIIKPLVTEKSSWEMEAVDKAAKGGEPIRMKNRYTFEVHPDANKFDIRAAISRIYGVRVLSVATQNRLGKLRRTRWGVARSRSWKRATVKLHPDDKIDLF